MHLLNRNQTFPKVYVQLTLTSMERAFENKLRDWGIHGNGGVRTFHTMQFQPLPSQPIAF